MRCAPTFVYSPPVSTPRVSIALPVYNGEPYLQITLADLAAQTFEDWEIVICDNASTDGTEALVREAASGDPRIRYVRNERNLGALPNANKAIALGRAPLTCLWGHDDRHHPDFLADLVGALDDAPEAVLAYPAHTLLGPDGEVFTFHPDPGHFTDARGGVYDYDRGLERPLPVDPVVRFREALAATDIDAPIHGVFRRWALDRVGPMSIHGSDRLTIAHAALLGPLAYVPKPRFGFRIHEQSTYHMDEATRLERETGGATSSRSGLETLRRYLAAPLAAGLSVRQAMRGVASATVHGLRQAGAIKTAAPSAPIEPCEGWEWIRSFETLFVQEGVSYEDPNRE